MIRFVNLANKLGQLADRYAPYLTVVFTAIDEGLTFIDIWYKNQQQQSTVSSPPPGPSGGGGSPSPVPC